MLSERILRSSNYFQVSKESVDSKKNVYYAFFGLEDDIEKLENKLIWMPYWDPKDPDTKVNYANGKYVLVVEKEDDKVVGRQWFYPYGEVNKKNLEVTVEKKKRYGKNAYMLTVTWLGYDNCDTINSRYLYLMNDRNEKFYFLEEYISPLDPNGREDKYVFELPEGDTLDRYTIGVEPILEEKYFVSTQI